MGILNLERGHREKGREVVSVFKVLCNRQCKMFHLKKNIYGSLKRS